MMDDTKLILMSSVPDSAIEEMKELSKQWLDQSFKLDEEFEQKLKKDEVRWPNKQYLVVPRACGKTGRLIDELKEEIENSVKRKKRLMRLEKEHLVDMVFGLESRNETLVNNLLEVERMYNDLKGEKENG